MWARAQAASGLVFALFGTLHLLNLASATLGPAVYNGFQRFMRPVQHFPLVEVLFILLPIAIHLVAAVVRVRARSHRRPAAKNLALRYHRYAGYYLALFIVGHIGASRLPALLFGAYPEFGGVAYTFQVLPQWFYPYYTLLALAGLTHLCTGVPLALRTLGIRIPSPLTQGARFWLPVGLIGILLLGGVAALSGNLFPVESQAEHPFAKVLQRFYP